MSKLQPNLPYQGAREWADLERFGLPKTLAVFRLKLGISFVYKMKQQAG